MSILNWLFGCRHERMGFPISPRRRKRVNPAAIQTGTYIVCLDCGKEWPYDWARMKIAKAKTFSYQCADFGLDATKAE